MIYVMSDLHGMYDKYIKMLEIINFSENDILYVLGDVVDRGNQSIKILQDMMLRSNVFPICGNHEVMAVECLKLLCKEITDEFLNQLDEKALIKLSNWINNGAYQTICEFKKLSQDEREDIMSYIMEFSAYEEVSVNGNEYLLVHAGLDNYSLEKSLDDYDIDELVWVRPDWDVSYFDNSHQYVIVGHTPTIAITGKPEIFYKNGFIAIDCGACFDDGLLACLCLDTMEEFYV